MAKMTGVEKLTASFNRLPKAVQTAVTVSLEKEVEDLVAAIKRVTPVSELEDQPGQLRDSVTYYPTPGRPLSFRIIAAARDRKGRKFARYVEFGHTSKSGRYVPAQPFFWPTYRARKKAMRRRIMAPARKIIRQMFPKV
jgi:HK97 gp10 family phage protein